MSKIDAAKSTHFQINSSIGSSLPTTVGELRDALRQEIAIARSESVQLVMAANGRKNDWNPRAASSLLEGHAKRLESSLLKLQKLDEAEKLGSDSLSIETERRKVALDVNRLTKKYTDVGPKTSSVAVRSDISPPEFHRSNPEMPELVGDVKDVIPEIPKFPVKDVQNGTPQIPAGPSQMVTSPEVEKVKENLKPSTGENTKAIPQEQELVETKGTKKLVLPLPSSTQVSVGNGATVSVSKDQVEFQGGTTQNGQRFGYVGLRQRLLGDDRNGVWGRVGGVVATGDRDSSHKWKVTPQLQIEGVAERPITGTEFSIYGKASAGYGRYFDEHSGRLKSARGLMDIEVGARRARDGTTPIRLRFEGARLMEAESYFQTKQFPRIKKPLETKDLLFQPYVGPRVTRLGDGTLRPGLAGGANFYGMHGPRLSYGVGIDGFLSRDGFSPTFRAGLSYSISPTWSASLKVRKGMYDRNGPFGRTTDPLGSNDREGAWLEFRGSF